MTDHLPEKPKAETPTRRKRIPTRLIAEALQASSGLPVLAAKLLNCNVSTIYQRLTNEPGLRRIQEYAREEIVDLAEMGLRTAVLDRESWALQFVLRTLGRTRGYVEPSKYTLEVSGAGGGAFQHEHTIQHVVRELSNDPAYLDAARQHAANQFNTIDSFARPVGIPATPNLNSPGALDGDPAPLSPATDAQGLSNNQGSPVERTEDSGTKL